MNLEQALEYADNSLSSTGRCRILGNYFGYPDCFIEHFIKTAEHLTGLSRLTTGILLLLGIFLAKTATISLVKT